MARNVKNVESPDVRFCNAKGFAACYSPTYNVIFIRRLNEFTVEYLLNHENLHKVLWFFIGEEASIALDNITFDLVIFDHEKPL